MVGECFRPFARAVSILATADWVVPIRSASSACVRPASERALRIVVTAVQALTKTDGEARVDAARRAVANPIARNVKLADVRDNMDLRRIPNPTRNDYARLEEYRKVEQILLAGPEA